MSSEALKKLENLTRGEYEDLYRDLISFAEFRLGFNSNRGVGAEDIVNTVFRKVIDTERDDHRKWDPQKNPNFRNFLRGCVSSEISNHFNLKATESRSDPDSNPDINFFENLESGSDLIDEIHGKELRDFLFDELVEIDEKLAEVLYFTEEGYKPNELVDKLGFSDVNEVYNIKKRLRRACEGLLEKFKNE